MRYDSFNEAYLDLLRLVAENGKPLSARAGSLGGTRELLDVGFSIPSTRPLCTLAKRQMSYAFALMEPFYLFTHQGKTDIAEALMQYAPNLKKLALNEGRGEFDGNYGDRIHLRDWTGDLWGKKREESQLLRVYNLLKKDPNSRRAVITIHNPVWDIIDGDSKDIPCTLNLQFIIRGQKLHCFCQMRSNDVWYGTPHNVMMFTFLQRALAGWLGVKSGDYYHRANSFHMYDKHMELAQRVTGEVMSGLPQEISYPRHESPTVTYNRALHMINWEKEVRQAIKDGKPSYHPRAEDDYEAIAASKVLEHLESRNM